MKETTELNTDQQNLYDSTLPSLDRKGWSKVARLMLLSRRLDQLEVEQLTPQGKVKYQFSSGGHELGQILLALGMNQPKDAATVYYRSRPFLLASGLTAAEALAAGMARTSSPSQGRDVGVVYNLPRRSGPTILPASGDVGAQYTPAAGWAQAVQYYSRVLGEPEWEKAIAAACGGDGSVAANGFWAALTLATTLRLPLLFLIEDNHYGISVHSDLQTPGGNIATNLAAFQNLQILEADGTEPQLTWNALQSAITHCRAGSGPCLVRLEVPRLSGHTFVDDQAYKSAAERADDKNRDPLPKMRAYLEKLGAAPQEWEKMEGEVEEELRSALETALSCPEPSPTETRHHLFYEGAAPRQGGLRPEGALPELGSYHPQPSGPRINFLDAVRRALQAEMELNPRLLVFGEDVGAKGGVHGATIDLQSRFGAERVFDTSLSEEGIMGRAVGLALAGLLPVPEIQFRKYADPAQEQINDLGTLRWRTANAFAAPVVVRIPVGFGKKTGDPWHSVTSESIYAHTPGWRIAFPSNAADAVGLLRTALRSDDPTFFFEHRALLDTPEGRRPYPGHDYCLPFGQAALLQEGRDLVVITWGAMVARCLEAVHSLQASVTLLDLRTIVPWDQEAVLKAVRRTGKVLIVQEDMLTAGFASEICTTIQEQAFTDLDAPIERMGMPDIPVPFNLAAMEALLPNPDSIRAKIERLLAF